MGTEHGQPTKSKSSDQHESRTGVEKIFGARKISGIQKEFKHRLGRSASWAHETMRTKRVSETMKTNSRIDLARSSSWQKSKRFEWRNED
jgi:hypothetical protein